MTVLAARYLLPAEYGTYMLAVVFAELALVFAYSGFFHYLITSPQDDAATQTTLFWIILGIGVITGTVLLLAATPLARLFSAPDLAPTLVVFAILQPFAAMVSWATGCLKRAQRMRRYFWVLLLSNLMALVLGAWALVVFQSLLALIAYRVTRLTLALILFLPAAAHRPQLRFDWDIYREAFADARSLYGARLAGFFAAYGTDLLLAFFFTTTESGLYRFANRLAQAAIDIAALPIKSLALQGFGQAARTGGVTASLCAEYLSTSAFFMAGIAITQIVLGAAAILALFPPDYSGAIGAFYALSLRHAALFGYHLLEPAMAAIRQSTRALRYYTLWAVLLVLVTLILAPFGLVVLAFGQALVAIVSTGDALRVMQQQSILCVKDLLPQLTRLAGGLAFYTVVLGLFWRLIQETEWPALPALAIVMPAALILSTLLTRWLIKRGFLSLGLFASR